MPTYDYICPTCQKQVEVFGKMSDIDNPSQSFLAETSCKADVSCIISIEENLGKIVDGEQLPKGQRFEKQITDFQFNAFSLLEPNEKKARNLKRSNQHFKKELTDVKRQNEIDDAKKMKELRYMQ